MKIKALLSLFLLLNFTPILGAENDEYSNLLLDGFDQNDWKIEGKTIKTVLVEGKTGKALEIDYTVSKTDTWVQIVKEISLPEKLREGKALEFFLKVKSGKVNNLEIKLVDGDESNFVFVVPLRVSGDYEKIHIDMRDFKYGWGGDNKLSDVKKIYFAVSMNDGGSGLVMLDDLRLVSTSVLLDGFEKNDWEPIGKVIKKSLVEGKTGKALQIDYEVNQKDSWVQVTKNFSLPEKLREGKAIEFYLKVPAGKMNHLEVKLVDGDESNFVYKAPLHPTEGFEKIHIDMGDFKYGWGGDAKLADVKRICFAVSLGDGGVGTIALDELKLVASGKKYQPKISSGLFDTCDDLQGWGASGSEGSRYNIMNVPGAVPGKAVALDYDFGYGYGKWVHLFKNFQIEATDKSVFRFFFKWTGEENILEFKVVDKDQSNFGKMFPLLGIAGEWKEILIPVPDLTYLSGGDNRLNMDSIESIWFVVSRRNGGKGTIAVDQLEIR